MLLRQIRVKMLRSEDLPWHPLGLSVDETGEFVGSAVSGLQIKVEDAFDRLTDLLGTRGERSQGFVAFE